MQNKVLCVTGVSGSGKTYFAKKLARKKNYKYIDVNKIITENKGVVSGYYKKLKTRMIDVEKFKEVLDELIKNSKENLVIDSHLSHYIDKKYVGKVYVVKTDIKELRKRLKKRGYSKNKIEENVEAEIMNTCYNEAKEIGHKVEVVLG